MPYRIELQTGELYASYTIRASAGTPDTNGTVVALVNPSQRAQGEVRTAITDGEYHAPLGEWNSFPASLDGTEYIRYENETYNLRYTVGDYWARVLTVEEAG